MLNALNIATTTDVQDAVAAASMSPEDLADTLRSVLGSSLYSNGLLWSVGTYLNQSGVPTNTANSNSITNLIRLGFLGLGNMLIGPNGQTIYQRTPYGGDGVVTAYTSNFAELLRYYLYDLSAAQYIRPGQQFLTTTGNLSTATGNVPISNFISAGLIGLNSNLTSSLATINTTDNNGFSTLSTRLSTLNTTNSSGFSTNHSDLVSFQQSNSSLLRTIDTTLVPEAGQPYYRFAPGTVADQVTYHSLSQILAMALSNISHDLVLDANFEYLGSNGLVGKSSTLTSLSTFLSRSLMGIGNDLTGNAEGSYFTWIDYTDPNNTRMTQVSNILDALGWIDDIQNLLALYLYSHGTDLDIKERENMQAQADAFVDDFTSSSGQGTPTVGNISDTAGMSGGFKNSFSGDSTTADIFSQLGDDGNYGFFSFQVQQELNPMYNSRVYIDDGYVDLIPDQLSDLLGGLGSKW